MPRHNESISAVISLATKHGNRSRLESSLAHELRKGICTQRPSRLHQLQTRNSEPLGGQAVDFTHLFRGEGFHNRCEELEQHVAQSGVRGALGLFSNGLARSHDITTSSRR